MIVSTDSNASCHAGCQFRTLWWPSSSCQWGECTESVTVCVRCNWRSGDEWGFFFRTQTGLLQMSCWDEAVRSKNLTKSRNVFPHNRVWIQPASAESGFRTLSKLFTDVMRRNVANIKKTPSEDETRSTAVALSITQNTHTSVKTEVYLSVFMTQKHKTATLGQAEVSRLYLNTDLSWADHIFHVARQKR